MNTLRKFQEFAVKFASLRAIFGLTAMRARDTGLTHPEVRENIVWSIIQEVLEISRSNSHILLLTHTGVGSNFFVIFGCVVMELLALR